MKKVMCAVSLCVVASVSNAGSVQIPQNFRGDWASAADCKASKNVNDTEAAMSVVRIAATGISYGEQSCEVRKVAKSDATHLAGNIACAGEGDEVKGTISLALEGDKLRLGGSVFKSATPLPRCK